MTAQSRTVLKGYFLRGIRPTQAQYGDLIDSFELVSGSSSGFLPLTGGIMTGAIQLPGVPTSALAAATKGYVDAIVSAGGVIAGGSDGQIQYNNLGGLGGLTVSGDGSLARTGVFTLNNTAVSAGTYELATVTFNSKGLATGASTGSGSTVVKSVKKQIFTNSATYTPSAGILYAIVEVQGGGAGAAGTNTALYTGGGGAGSYSKAVLTAATIGSSQSVTIGAGGAGGSGSAAGTDGGTSSFGAIISCVGGVGSAIPAAGSNLGGLGGTASGGDLNIPGAPGGTGYGLAGVITSGQGANSFYGAGGRSIVGNVATNGNDGTGYGSGGGGPGASGLRTGGSGANGVVYITEFCSV